MRRTSIFFSYRRVESDIAALDELLVHLEPHAARGKISLWVDRDLEPGEDWEERIVEAITEARLAVLLVSAPFLNSDFIRDIEVPLLLAAAETRRLRLLCYYLSPSHADELDFAFADPETRERRTRKLTDLMGLNDPGKPLARLDGVDREHELARAARKILELGSRPDLSFLPRELHDLVLRLEAAATMEQMDVETVREIVRPVIPSRYPWDDGKTRSVGELLHDLARVPPRSAGGSPLLAAAERLMPRLSPMTRAGIGDALSRAGTTSAAAAAAPAEPARGAPRHAHLITTIEPLQLNPGRYGLSMSLEDEVLVAATAEAAYTPTELAAAFEGEITGRCGDQLMRFLARHGLRRRDAWLHFVLPRELLAEAVDQWRRRWGTVGTDFRVSISSWERWRDLECAVSTRSCWTTHKDRGRPAWGTSDRSAAHAEDEYPCVIVDGATATARDVFFTTKDEKVACAILESPPAPVAPNDRRDHLNALLFAGVPAILWSRKEGVGAQRVRSAMGAPSFIELPATVYDIRNRLLDDELADVAGHLSILWDDPEIHMQDDLFIDPVEGDGGEE